MYRDRATLPQQNTLLDQHRRHTTQVFGIGTATTIAAGGTACSRLGGRRLIGEHRHLHTGLPVLVQIANHIVEAVGVEPPSERDGDLVAEHVHGVDVPRGEQAPCQHRCRTRPHGFAGRAERFMPLPGERTIRLETHHTGARTRLLHDTDHLTHTTTISLG